ncbi:MAG: mannose-1-phosphate guanylyltransferase/mannose-6-phosphate isomerase, partial [Pseudomonas sp.]
MIPVILSGGSGSRLWPLSRKQLPKQFLALTGDHTLFQQTLERLAFDGMQPPVIVCNKDHRFIVQEQLSALKLSTQAILLEPFGRNTAPAVAIAALKLLNEGRDELLLVLPADHVIEDQKAFQRALSLATIAAEKGELVLFGVPANKPETGYGYIKSSPDALLPDGVSRVAQFVEKPNEQRAAEFVKSGNYFWNSGMFLFRASRFLDELKKHDPDIYDTCLLALERSQHEGDHIEIDEATFECCPDNSIDYAVMEKTQRACVVPLAAGWSDVGCWSSIWDVLEKDSNGNVTKGDVVVRDSHNCLVHGNGKLVSVIGLENIVVVETKDAMMIAHKDRVQEVKQLVNTLNEQGRSETQN